MTKGLIRWSVEHPYAVIAFYVGIIILFIVGLPFLPLRMMPYIQSPMIAIVTMAPGMSPREVETYITKPVEERMTDIRGIRYIRSTSQQNNSIVSLEFWYGWDMKKAFNDVQQLMQIVQGDLPYDPANLKPSWVLAIDPLNLPVITFSLTGDGWDPIKLREFADNIIVRRLKTAKGVESVTAFGGLKRQAQIIVDSRKLAAYGISLMDLEKMLNEQNIDQSAGTLTYREGEALVRLPARALSGKDFSRYVIGKGKNGEIVYLNDIAKTLDTFQERRSLYRYNGDETVAVQVVQEPWGSAPHTIDNVMKEVEKLTNEYPGIKFDPAFDTAHFIKIVRKNMFEELGIAIILTAIVLFLFLGEWRGTVIALVTIPASLGIAMLAFFPAKLSMNSSTLIGLLLAIGRLVDDSIIDLHSIQRHLKMGKPPKQAAIDGSSEVRGAVISSTFMLVLALLPLTFSGGLTQEMFNGINWPFIFALLASLLVSLTLTPLLAATLYPLYDPARRDPVERIVRPFLRLLDGVEKRYRGILGWALNHRATVMALVISSILVVIQLFPYIGYEMMPLADVGQAYLQMEAQPGTSLAKTAQMTLQLENIMKKYPEIEKISTMVGSEPGGTYFTGYGMGGVNTASIMVTFSDKEERKQTIWNVIDRVEKEALSAIPGIRRFNFKEMGSDVMASSRAPIEILIHGPELPRLSWLAEETKKMVQKNQNVYQSSTSWNYTQPEYRLKIDLRRAQELGLTPKEIANQAYYALNGGLTREYFNPPLVRHGTVLIRLEQGERRHVKDLEDLLIILPEGALSNGVRAVPLVSVAKIEEGFGPSVIERDNLRRSISVMGYYRQGGPGSMQLTMDIMMKSIMNLSYPPGFGVEQRGDMTQMMDSFGRLLRGMGLAFLFIYLVLAVQFRSFAQPFTMMMAIPLEYIGCLIALILAHQTFSTVSILGVILLSGIDVTASILIVDKIMQLREGGKPREEAVLEAGPVRLRPILMTVGITMVVLFPVAFFPKTGMDAYAPLATVVVGGLTASTFLTLIAIPVIYTVIDDLVTWIRRFILRKSEH